MAVVTGTGETEVEAGVVAEAEKEAEAGKEIAVGSPMTIAMVGHMADPTEDSGLGAPGLGPDLRVEAETTATHTIAENEVIRPTTVVTQGDPVPRMTAIAPHVKTETPTMETTWTTEGADMSQVPVEKTQETARDPMADPMREAEGHRTRCHNSLTGNTMDH